MKILNTEKKGFGRAFKPVLNRFEGTSSNKEIANRVSLIVDDVRKNGDKALFSWTKKLDKLNLNARNLYVSQAKLNAAKNDLPPKLQAAINKAFRNIKAFHKKQLEKSWTIKTGKSSRVGQLVRPMDRVGLYVPGGTASYPSSVLMNAIPALVAGVKEIILCSPAPKGKINPAVLYAANLCGIKKFCTVGGAQAVAAMAYGTKSIPKVDKITGPGNAYVAEAKRLVFGQVDIDMIAGPSEICVIADDTANPGWVAADLLSQAEHDELAWPILVSPSADFIDKTIAEINDQVKTLERREIAEKCLNSRFYAIKTKSIAEAIDIANELAIEHLELSFDGAINSIDKVRHAGAIFVGHYSPEVLGDYMAGPNHVLPTSGSARFFSPLGVYDFTKRSSIISYSKKDFLALRGGVAIFAESEGLTAHAKAAKLRN